MPMPPLRPWCWEPLACGGGPDWLFVAEVTSSRADALARAARAHALPGFTRCPTTHAYCPTHQRSCAFHACIDTPNADAYRANRAAARPRNIWIYDHVQVHATMVEVTCGYGGRGAAYHDVETAFLRDLLSAEAISLRSWKVLAGGEGYEFRTLREGTDIASLLAYLSR